MFDCIIGQDNVINLLKNDLKNQTINNSILFYGTKSVGKLKSALEVTRVLNCLNKGEDTCACTNCRRINELNFEGLIFLSRRNYSSLLEEYISCYVKNNNPKYLEGIKKVLKLVTMPLQDFLINDTFSEQDKKDFFSYIEKISQILDIDNPVVDNLKKITDIVNQLYNKYKSYNIPIDTIRSMLDWTYINQPDIKRVVIIDHVDHLEKASQNILLKRVEEPSKNLFFILIAENKNKIAQTILSRCRLYYFNKLNSEKVKYIIFKEFEADSTNISIDGYLKRNEETSKENMLPVIGKLLNLVFQKEAPFSDLTLFINSLKERKYVKALLIELVSLLENDFLKNESNLNNNIYIKAFESYSAINISFLKSLIIKKANIIEEFGLNPILLLEGIFYPLKAMVENDKL